jgi:hypothetical protein
VGKRWAGWALSVAVVVSMLDIGASYWALRSGIGQERNVVAALVMSSVGVLPTLTVGLVLRIVVAAALAYIGTEAGHLVARRAAGVTLTAVALWWSFIALHAVQVVALAR